MTNPPRGPGRPPAEAPLHTYTVRLRQDRWEGLGDKPRKTLQDFTDWYNHVDGAELPQRPAKPAAKKTRRPTTKT